jgi:hypothetical protein
MVKITLTIIFVFSISFAQVVPRKLAVYVSGADEAVNKSLGSNLLVAMTQSGEYSGIVNHDSFQDELADGKGDVFQVANHYGADYVCAVNITEVVDSYSITAHLVKIDGSQVVKIVSTADHAIKSLDDLTAVSNEFASQLLPPVVALAAPQQDTVPLLAVAAPVEEAKESDSGEGKDKSWVSFGIRMGFNLSHIHAKYSISGYGRGNGDYGDYDGGLLGFVVDFAASDWLHIQPGLMFIKKGMHDKNAGALNSYYLEFPLLFSLKQLVFRFNMGPYVGLYYGPDYNNDIYNDKIDIGLSTGIGFDIGMLYIGVFYDYGFTDISAKSGYNFYNRTHGFNLGVNL